MSDELQRLAVFQDKQVRKTLHLGDPKRLRQRDKELSILFESVGINLITRASKRQS